MSETKADQEGAVAGEAEAARLGEMDADQLRDRLRKRSDRAREKASRRVSAQDVLARGQARREEKSRLAASPEGASIRARRRSKAGAALGVVLLVAAGLCLSAAISTGQASAASQVSNAARIQSLQGQVDYVKPPDPAQADSQIASVRAQGQAVADLENQFASLLASDTAQAGNGVPSAGFLAAVAHRKQLAPYFAKGTYLLPDATAYSPGSNLGLGPGQIDPRLQWYQRVASDGAYAWSVAAVAPSAAGDPSLTDVTWLCSDTATGAPLAWAVGTWSKDVKAFTSLTVGTTALGDAQNAQAGSSAPASQNGSL